MTRSDQKPEESDMPWSDQIDENKEESKIDSSAGTEEDESLSMMTVQSNRSHLIYETSSRREWDKVISGGHFVLFVDVERCGKEYIYMHV